MVCPFRRECSLLGGQVAVFWAYKLYCRYIGTFFRISIYKIPATCELVVNL